MDTKKEEEKEEKENEKEGEPAETDENASRINTMLQKKTILQELKIDELSQKLSKLSQLCQRLKTEQKNKSC